MASLWRMGEVAGNSGLLPKIHGLFNNSLFSDIQFIFSDNDCSKKIYCHKLILALRSRRFAQAFFEEENSTSIIELPSSKKAAFELLFRFLYTDDVQFHGLEEAEDLYNLATEYEVEELCEKCYKYILREQLTLENVLSKYDYALRKNIEKLLVDCRHFVCTNTEQILKSKSFTNASFEVIEDIVKQDNLLLSTELVLITAILNWGEEDLKRKDCNRMVLRERINPVMKHLRFLTLSQLELFNFIEKHHNILSPKESFVLTSKILQPECKFDLPKDICAINYKRSVTSNESSSLDPLSLDCKFLEEKFLGNQKSDSSTHAINKVQYPTQHRGLNFEILPQVKDPSKYTTNYSSKHQSSSVLKHASQDTLKSKVPDSSKSQAGNFLNSDAHNFSKFRISDPPEMKRGTVPAVKKTASPTERKISSTQAKQIKQPFAPFPNHSNWALSSPERVPKEYAFPLKEIQPIPELSFQRDINCNVSFTMKTGNIRLRGFDLKMKHKDKTEELRAFVHMTGFSGEPFGNYYTSKLKSNGVFSVRLPERMILQEGKKGELEVSIEDLALNRCSACPSNDVQRYELNQGLDFAVEFYLTSNQRKYGFLFLIDKLFFDVL